jgi:hypothetical protein
MSDDIAQRLAKLEDAFAYHVHPSRSIQTEGPINLAGWKPASNPQFRVTEAPFLTSDERIETAEQNSFDTQAALKQECAEHNATKGALQAALERAKEAEHEAKKWKDCDRTLRAALQDAEVRCATLVAALPPRHTCEVPDYSDGYNMCRATIIDRFRAAGVKTIID